jgi:hypothetical protein
VEGREKRIASVQGCKARTKFGGFTLRFSLVRAGLREVADELEALAFAAG